MVFFQERPWFTTRHRCYLSQVAPADLAPAFVTSVGGVITFTLLSPHGTGSLANRDRARGWRPGWCLHRCLHAAGLPDALIGRLAGILVIAIGVRNLLSGPD
jgi:hypothetical protein